ncbi:HAMP domain-containing protein [Donghicola sp. C2-DW-16]|uniref:histidine kinase n=1 Tax=Donghicola mangrovi TaxID=2729614 RepID=A0ABX2PDA7_9RHOB|nr:cache domain-containing protein [Donghicola mangrovi]NVO27446.1 HAMP domain-containing protein [Donghicola mangrovi]
MSERIRNPVSLRNTVRARLLVIALLPILILLPLLLVTAVKSWSDRMNEVLTAKVSGELTVARQHLDGLVQDRSAAIEALGRSALFRDQSRAPSTMGGFLEAERLKMGLDFLYYVTPRAYVVMAGQGGGVADPRNWPVVNSALNGRSQAAIDVFTQADLAGLSPDLAARARLELLPTQGAVPTDRALETRGMVVHAAAPAPGGALVGGVLLNRNLGFIDEINDLVYPEGSLTGANDGTATLFLDDVRVSTNVRLFEGQRALGTRVSAEVRDRVLQKGATWTARAFVVNDWYISAYEPIRDSFGRRIGMLYVGFLEAPFRQAEQRTQMVIWFSFLAVIAVTVPVLLFFARSIFRPLERMNLAIARVEGGDLSARSEISGRDDEIARLAAHLDTLLDQIQERDRRLRNWAEELETRVTERTADLQEANEQLEITTRQLILSEKLAALGEITAGVAHEINNPLAVIQGNLDVIQDHMGEAALEYRIEFKLIQEQIQAISILVTKLLSFSRPEEFDLPEQGINPDNVVRATLPLVQHILTKSGVALHLELDGAGDVSMNETELQQVIVNLITNAVQAMPAGGDIHIRTRLDDGWARPMIVLEVRDTGAGMTPEVSARIFDPFYSTKGAKGTGLGLSITRDILRRAGGSVSVNSVPGQGATFTVRLPIKEHLPY